MPIRASECAVSIRKGFSVRIPRRAAETFDEQNTSGLHVGELPACTEWLYRRKGQAGDADVPGQDSRGVHASQPAEGSGNRARREVAGFDGPQGKGGSITVTYDPKAKPYLTAIRLSNRGGRPPVFKEESVAPLW